MRLAVIDSRQNNSVSIQKAGSDLLPPDSCTQFVIDLDQIPKATRIIVPAWVCIVHENGDVTPCPGVLQLPENSVITPVLPHLQIWCKAGLLLAQRQFKKVLKKNPTEAVARIAYWTSGANELSHGVSNKLDEDDLHLRILQQWPRWQTDAFKKEVAEKKLKLWATRLETIKAAGYKLSLDENRLQVEYGRMGFKVD